MELPLGPCASFSSPEDNASGSTSTRDPKSTSTSPAERRRLFTDAGGVEALAFDPGA
jgi:hypothetical protein